jgi:hypothetical protein
MTVYIFAGWPIGMKEDEYPARFLHDGTSQVCAVETGATISEALPDCRERLVFAPEVEALGINADSFSADHVFGNGVSCALVKFELESPPVELSWIVTPRAAGTLSSEKYSELKGLMVKKRA